MKNNIEILLSTYNGEQYLADQIDSILAQNYRNWRLLIRDDGSTDNTLVILKSYHKKYPDKIIIFEDNMGNLGVTKSFSLLVSKSDSDYVAFCDQDDVWLPDKLHLTYQKIKEVEKGVIPGTPIMVFSDLTVVDKDLNVISESLWDYQKLDPKISKNLYSILAQNIVSGCTILMNRNAKKISFPIPTNLFSHDHWVAINTCKYGVNVYVEKPLIMYRQHGVNEIGAIRVGPIYYFFRVMNVLMNIRNYTGKYRYLSFNVSLFQIFLNKIILNLKRLAS